MLKLLVTKLQKTKFLRNFLGKNVKKRAFRKRENQALAAICLATGTTCKFMFVLQKLLRNCPNIHRKTLVLESLSNKAARPATLLKKTITQMFSCKSWKIYRNSFFYRTPPVATFI